jgi:hypothetical protein
MRSLSVDEKFENVLIMNWRFRSAMPKKPPSTGIGRDEVQKMISPISEKLDEITKTNSQLAKPSWGSQLPAILISNALTLVIALLVARWQYGKTHDAEDLKRDIALEVTSQLKPIQGDINKIREDVAKIKGADGIAQSTPPNDIPAIKQDLAVAQAKGLSPNPARLEAFRSRLLASSQADKDYWPAVFYLIIFRSRYALVDPSAIKPAGIRFAGGGRDNTFANTSLELSGPGELTDSTFTNCIIKFSRKEPLKMKNVRFINCAFVFEVTASPTPEMKSLGDELIRAANPKDITISIG